VPTKPTTDQDTPRTEPTPTARKPFERPRLFRRGALPKVTTAFGGTFTP
jgi:hypothetical protein